MWTYDILICLLIRRHLWGRGSEKKVIFCTSSARRSEKPRKRIVINIILFLFFLSETILRGLGRKTSFLSLLPLQMSQKKKLEEQLIKKSLAYI